MDYPIHYYVIAAVAVLAVVAIIFWLQRRTTSRPRPQNPYIEALKLLVDGQREGAFQKLQQAVKTGYAPTDAYIKLGALLRERGEVAKAMQIHQSLTVRPNLQRPEQVELYLNLAEDHAGLGNSERAVKVLEGALKRLNIKDPDVYSDLARHLHVMGEHDRAYAALRETKKLGGIGERELALYMTSVAESMLEDGQPREARKTLQRALKHDANCAPCLLMLGNIAEDDGDLDAAIDRWRKVAVLSPDLAAVVLNKLETTLFEKGRFGEIEQVYNDVRAARVGDEAANLGLAAFYKKQGKGEEAIVLLEEYLTLHPDSVAASLLLASFYARHRDTETLQLFIDESRKRPARPDRFECHECHLKSDKMRWHCPRCNAFDSYSMNSHEV